MYCVNKKVKAKRIEWSELDAERPEDEQEVIRQNVRRDILDFQIPRMCDSYCYFPKLIKDEYAMNQVCEACPLKKIVRYMEVFEDV